MSSWNDLKNPYHDQRDPSTLRAVLGVLLFIVIVGAIGVLLLRGTIP